MLVLSRKAGEQIHIGENVTIEVRRIAGNRVALAVQAPREMRILRSELKEAATEFDGDQATTLSLVVEELDALPTAASA